MKYLWKALLIILFIFSVVTFVKLTSSENINETNETLIDKFSENKTLILDYAMSNLIEEFRAVRDKCSDYECKERVRKYYAKILKKIREKYREDGLD